VICSLNLLSVLALFLLGCQFLKRGFLSCVYQLVQEQSDVVALGLEGIGFIEEKIGGFSSNLELNLPG
jgi:hypothetical protein